MTGPRTPGPLPVISYRYKTAAPRLTHAGFTEGAVLGLRLDSVKDPNRSVCALCARTASFRSRLIVSSVISAPPPAPPPSAPGFVFIAEPAAPAPLASASAACIALGSSSWYVFATGSS